MSFVRDGQIIGIGTGTTIRYAIEGLGERVKSGLRITGVPTSVQSERFARELGIPLVELNDVEKIDLVIDGADEIDPAFNMIKGGGGALTREKLVAISAKERIVIVDNSKLVHRLGVAFPLPVEVLPFAWRLSQRLLGSLGCDARLRRTEGGVFETDNGNFILDCRFDGIADAPEMEKRIKLTAGVIECGLFIGLADTVIIGTENGVDVRTRAACRPE